MSQSFTRVELLRRGAAAGVVIALPTSFLAACGGDDEEAAGTTTGGKKQLAKTLRFSNWTLYIDIDEKTKKHPTLDEFQQKTGTKVEYHEDVNDNASYFGKIQRPLSQGQSIDRDIIVLTDNSRFPGLLIDKGWAEKLDKSAIPNFDNLQDALRAPELRPEPRVLDAVAVRHDRDRDEHEAHRRQAGHDDGRAARGPEPQGEGDVAHRDGRRDVARHARERRRPDERRRRVVRSRVSTAIKKAVDSGQIRQFTGNDYSGPLAKGDLAAAMSWSGDVVQLSADNANLVWNLPESGGDIWTDNMLIPKGGDVFTASTYMNFVYDPEVAAKIAAYVNYVTPVKGAKEEAAKIDPELADNPLIFPDDETLSKVAIFDSKALTNQDYLERWQALIGS